METSRPRAAASATEPAIIRLRGRGINFEETRHSEPFRMPKHSHDEAHMVLLFEGGIESYSYNQACVAARSELLFVPAGETHTSRYCGQVHAFYIQFHDAWWDAHIRQPFSGVLQSANTYSDSPPAWMAARLHREFQRRDDLTPLILEGLTLELLATMARLEPGQAKHDIGGPPPRWLLRGRDFLHAHFTESVTIKAVAEAAGVHPGHLMRGFRQHYGVSIGDYVRRLRVEQACRLLARPDRLLSFSQMAHSLGFADQSHFCRSIKRVTGKTPTELRNHAGFDRPEPDARLEQETLR